MRVAVWSGPRNLSTALMYSFGNRADMTAVDEPFYGAFLKVSQIEHPLGQETMDAMECDPARVPDGLRRFDTPHQYEKYMAHHMLPSFPMDWAKDVRNVILIRHPARVLASYLRKREAPTAEDLGFTMIDAIYQAVKDPIVIDSTDIRRDPKAALSALCAALGLPFDPAMLLWDAGPRPFDGAWAPHWYDAVHRSTGFDSAEGPIPDVPSDFAPMIHDALTSYEEMRAKSLRIG